MPNHRKPRINCLNCGKQTKRPGYKYCNNACQQEYQHACYVADWKDEKISGLLRSGVVSQHVKRYLREKFGNKCCLCGWAKENKVTKTVPLVADHIDGNWRNNKEENLRLICPNCDSLSSTYAALNKGNGRRNRKISIRVLEARALHDKKR